MMDQTRDGRMIHRRKQPSIDLKHSFFEEGKKVELQETVKIRCEGDHYNGDSFIISKRKRDPLMEEEIVGVEQDCGFSHRLLSSNNSVPKRASSSNNSVRKKTSKCSSSPTEEHIETEIAEVLYGLKSSRNQDSSEKLKTNGEYERKKVEDSSSQASKRSTMELAKIGREKLDDNDDTKSYVLNNDISKKVNLESIDLMAPPPTDVELGDSIKTEDKETKMDTFKKNQHIIKIDIEVPNKKDNDMLTNHQVKKTVSPAWSRNLPPLGNVPPSSQPIVETDKIIRSSPTALKVVDFVLSPPQPKRCASHYYIARNIFLHQQLLRVNSSSLCGTKPNNVNDVPNTESMITGKQSQVKKELVTSKFPILDENKRPDDGNSSLDSMQMEQQQGSYLMHQPSPTSHARSGNSSYASSSSNNSISSFASSLVPRDSRPTAQNSSTSIGLSSSSHNQSYGVQVKDNNMLSSPAAQLQLSHKLTTEKCQEKSPYIVGQKNVYTQNLTIPIHQPKNFSFRSSITSNSIGEKNQLEALKGGFELMSSQSFAISFHSEPSVAWQGYYSAWTTQDDERKVNSRKSSSTTNEPTNLVFDDSSSKYLSFVLSPNKRNLA